MAYEGELVRMQNGRWARFQAVRVCNAGHQDGDETTLLVAVELDDHAQALLSASHGADAEARRRVVPAAGRFDDEGRTWVDLSDPSLH